MKKIKVSVFLFLIAGVSLFGVISCGGGSGGGGQVLTDENGPFDITADDILRIFGAISTECGATSEVAPSAIEECEEVCNCSANAIAELEGRTESPIVVERCTVACDPEFAGTEDLPIPVDDEDDLPEFEGFFEAYIVKCDEIANRTTFTDGDDAQECIDICICLSDAIEQYVSPTTDDSIRAQCESSCQPPPAAATGRVLRPVLSAGF